MPDPLPINFSITNLNSSTILLRTPQSHKLLPIANSPVYLELIQPISENPSATKINHSIITQLNH